MPATDDFDYDLPAARIAQTPVEPRDAARLLVSVDAARDPEHRHVRDLPDCVGPGDLLVVNDTRVLPARLHLVKATGGAAEVFLLEPGAEPGEWDALVRPGRRLPPGTVLLAPGTAEAVVEVGQPVGDPAEDGRRRVRLLTTDALREHGTVPLPPYITAALADAERYQTVYARDPGSVAAPTAGLHLTTDILDRCRAAGAAVATVDLAVGLGTFKPITTDRVEDHDIHAERYRVPLDTLAACESARRVIAVGTTTVRALESAARGEPEGRTQLFIHGDFEFRLVDVLMTNFHMPRSSLLVLLDAFVGPRWRALYDLALAGDYRFLSFGDAMLIGRR